MKMFLNRIIPNTRHVNPSCADDIELLVRSTVQKAMIQG